MATNHICVWIDHSEAKIFSLSRDQSDEMVLHDAHAPRHIHRKADHLHLGKTPPDQAFFEEIAAALQGAKGIAIVGPGTARTELAGYLAEHRPLIGKRVWGIEAMDHPTDGQIAASARKFFAAADRMHG